MRRGLVDALVNRLPLATGQEMPYLTRSEAPTNCLAASDQPVLPGNDVSNLAGRGFPNIRHEQDPERGAATQWGLIHKPPRAGELIRLNSEISTGPRLKRSPEDSRAGANSAVDKLSLTIPRKINFRGL